MRAARRNGVFLLVALGLAGLVGLPSAATSTAAAWVDAEQAQGAGLTAGSVTRVASMTCTAGIASPARFTWPLPTGGLPRTGFRWEVTGALTGSGTLAAGATTIQLSSGLLGIGSGTFRLYAVSGTWESQPITGSVSLLTGAIWGCSVP